MRILCHYHMSLIFCGTISLSYFKYKTFLIVTPFRYLSYRMLCNNRSFLNKINSFRFEEKFQSMLSWNRKCQSKWTLRTNLKKFVFYRKKIEMVFIQIRKVINDAFSKSVLIVKFIHPQRETTLNILIWLIWKFYLFDTGSQHAHLSQIKSDSSHRVIEVTLCKIQLNGLLIIIRTFKGEFHLHHNRKVWRWHSRLLIFLFS